ncbi:MAG: L,D-transpeptidase [Anaerolineae bacterium]|nr:L,D-transpeptidase [Anaerolineae bacterium]
MNQKTVRAGLVCLLLLLLLALGAQSALAFPGDAPDAGVPAPKCNTAGGRLTSTQCQYGSLSPLELRAANAAAAAGQAVPMAQAPANLGYFGTLDYWRLVNGPIPVYDAPNGNVILEIAQGFSFFTVISWDGDWAQINYGNWVYRPDYMQPANVSTFAGALIPAYPERPFGWMLLDTRPSAAPGTPGDPDMPYIPRYTHITVYATVSIDGWNWYLIGPDRWVEQKRVSLIHPIAPPEGVRGRWVAVDLYEQNAVGYEDDRMVFATLISSGLPDWPTQEGLFEVWERVENGKMSGAEGQADFYYLENVPWTLYYDEGRSLHGTYWHDGFGYRHSHGCVNLSITDSAWFFDWTAGQEKTWVYVFSSGQYRE